MTKDKLWWFGHVQRTSTKTPVQKVDQMVFSIVMRGRGKPKRTLGEIIIRDLWINSIPGNLEVI